jgi:hypothetical protein
LPRAILALPVATERFARRMALSDPALRFRESVNLPLAFLKRPAYFFSSYEMGKDRVCVPVPQVQFRPWTTARQLLGRLASRSLLIFRTPFIGLCGRGWRITNLNHHRIPSQLSFVSWRKEAGFV